MTNIKFSMIHYYLLIQCGKVLDTSARFYKVSIGSSRQAVRDFLSLTALSVERGYYFHLWDENTTEFVGKCLASVWGSSDALTFANHLQQVTSRELLKVIRDEVSLPLDDFVLSNAHRCMTFLDINYRCALGARK